MAETLFRFGEGIADAAWIRLDRWNALTNVEKASFVPICPDTDTGGIPDDLV
jgi:Uma2 family endonuclease